VNGTLIDTNVLADTFDTSSPWNGWSTDAILLAEARGPILVNPIIVAEASIPFSDPLEFEQALGQDIEQRSLPWSAAFLAGKAFREYRRRGGTRRSPLPDFYIGAHAAVERLQVLTRDPKRFLSYFRGITVIAPDDA
jgi:predicted nucleic acid-binding protein